eukprot:9162-Pelagococcus_subviridis.AAC.1
MTRGEGRERGRGVCGAASEAGEEREGGVMTMLVMMTRRRGRRADGDARATRGDASAEGPADRARERHRGVTANSGDGHGGVSVA